MIDGLQPYPVMKDSGVEWLGEVPEQWEVAALRHRYSQVLGKMLDAKRITGDHLVPYLRNIDVQWDRIETDDLPRMDISPEEFERYTVRPGDLLVCEGGEVGRAAIWKGALPLCGYQKALHRLRPLDSERDVTRFLYFALRTATQVNAFSDGHVSTIAHLTGEKLRGQRFPFPSADEQAAIVRFLDHADRRIRRYIRAKKKLIKLLEEQRQAIIHRAVTRGLDPNVRLKPSGVEWLGDVPEHWEVRTLGQLASSFRTGPFGSALHQSEYVERGTPIVNPTHMRGGRIIADEQCSVPSAVAERLSKYAFRLHDVAFSRRGELGRCVLVREPEVGWICGTGSLRIRIRYIGLEPEFLIQALQVRWVGEYLSLFSVGATMDSLNTGILKGLPILVPPIDEQRKILGATARMTSVLCQAVDGAQREIDLLREYRSRLIAGVVTGKLDVREAAARLPNEAEEPERFDEIEAEGEMEEAGPDDADEVAEEAVA